MINNPIIAAVFERLYEQQEKGLNKYGKLVDTDSHTLIEWLEHALQEQTDLLIYMECIKQKLMEEVKK